MFGTAITLDLTVVGTTHSALAPMSTTVEFCYNCIRIKLVIC